MPTTTRERSASSSSRSTGHVLASGNRVWGNRAPSYDYGWDGSAFEIYGASNVTITDNVAWDNENVLETGTDKSGPACSGNVFARNVAYGGTTARALVGHVPALRRGHGRCQQHVP